MNERDKRPWVKASKVSFFPRLLARKLQPFLHSPPQIHPQTLYSSFLLALLTLRLYSLARSLAPQDDRDRYKREMSRYKPPFGFDSNGEKKATSVKGKGKRKRDPQAPKRPLSAYFLYQKTHWSALKEKHPNKSFGELATLMSKTWAKLGASTKKEWEDKASEDKTRYEREMAEYTPPVGGTYGKDGMSIVPLCKKEYPALKKPRSAYVIFFKEQRAKVRGRCK